LRPSAFTTRPDVRHNDPEQSVPLPQLWALLVSFKDEELLAKGKILSRQIRDDVELSREISTAILDDFKHQLSLRGEECKLNGSNAYE
jgi:hypothetical protein